VPFSRINSAQTAGTVNSSPGLAGGGSGMVQPGKRAYGSSIAPGASKPEPSSIFLLGTGLIGIGTFLGRRRYVRHQLA